MAPNTVNRKASALLKHGMVRARIETAQQQLAAASAVSVGELTADLREIARQARGDREWAPAVNAILGLAKLHGLLVRKTEITTGGEFRIVRRLEPARPAAPELKRAGRATPHQATGAASQAPNACE